MPTMACALLGFTHWKMAGVVAVAACTCREVPEVHMKEPSVVFCPVATLSRGVQL